jgi:hypothetical protein
MSKRVPLIAMLLLIVGLLGVAGWNVVADSGATSNQDIAHVPTGQASRFHYGVRDLNGAAPEEVGQFALEYVQHHLKVSGRPEVALAKAIKPNDLPALGLGCPIEFGTIEQPPLTLVILKGKFDISRVMRGQVGNDYLYVAYVFDHWSARHTLFQWSRTGSSFRTALNDPSLPLDKSSVAMACPTEIAGKKDLHYGDILPTVLPSEFPEAFPMPTSPLPSPIPTEESR